MSQHLVIVESPAKGKTIEKYLGRDYQVLASFGHVRDLIAKDGAVDPDNNFAMKYVVSDRSVRHVESIKRALKGCNTLMLATDPDREGEAISWHLTELLKDAGALKNKKVVRVVFHEITRSAVQQAVQNPRELDADLIDAQQTRRALDFLVGFNLSPVLWKKVHSGLSAGRVQTPALRLICEREDAIDAFVAKEYWNVAAHLEKASQAFTAKLSVLNKKKVSQFTVTNAEQANDIKAMLHREANGKLTAIDVEKKQRRRYATAPFTTSTLQQEASRKLGFGAERTMRVAQKLYEGKNVGEGVTGLITYMRTDSVTLSSECIAELRQLIPQRYGKEYLPKSANTYQNKSKNAQEAHEAIRPTSVMRSPDRLRKYLDTDQYKLYNLIWQRTVASQMIYATIDQVGVDLSCGTDHRFRATGSTVRFPGFMKVYREDVDDRKPKKNNDDTMLPSITTGDEIPLKDIVVSQHFTEPPPRYTEASLVKALEEYGIGRPSTYAAIISTLQNRGYAELISKRFHPTDTGRVVSRFLSKHFEKYVSYDFTAQLEDELDAISRGENAWIPVLDSFWKPFITSVENVIDTAPRDDTAADLGVDPQSGKRVSVRCGKYGAYAQLGTRDDEEKPTFASLRPGQRMDSITLEEALKLFSLPRELGISDQGEKISASIGPHGPYIKYGAKYASITDDTDDDPYTITLERALQLVAQKKIVEANWMIKEFCDHGIRILNGRYGPYITDGKKNAKIPKNRHKTAADIDLDTCIELLAKAPEKREQKKPDQKSSPRKKSASNTRFRKKSASKKRAWKSAASKKPAARKKSTVRKVATKKARAKKVGRKKTAS